MTSSEKTYNKYYSGADALCLIPNLTRSAHSFFRHGGSKIYPHEFSGCTFDGVDRAWAVDFSFDYLKTFKKCNFIGGKEGVIKVCRGGDLTFEDCTFISKGGRFPVCFSSGVKDVIFNRCKFINESLFRKTSCVFLLGHWSIFDTSCRLFSRNIHIKQCKLEGFGNLLLGVFSGLIKVENTAGRVFQFYSKLVKLWWKFKNFILDKRKIKRPMGSGELFQEEL